MSEARRRATYDDLLALPDNVIGEIVGGVLYASPRPGAPHSNVAGEVLGALGGVAQRRGGGGRGGGPGGWHILFEPELHLRGDILVPDVCGWRLATLPRIPNAPAIEVAPDWVCEVLSLKTARLDRIKKMPRYAAHGVGHAWLVDPVLKTLEVYRLTNGVWALIGAHEGEEVVRAEPFDVLELHLGDWWLPDEE